MPGQLLYQALGAIGYLSLAWIVGRWTHFAANVVWPRGFRLLLKLAGRVVLELLDLVATMMRLQLAASAVMRGVAPSLVLGPFDRVFLDASHQISVS